MMRTKSAHTKQVVFLISSKVNLGVIESQVFKLASFISDHYGYKVTVLICHGPLQFDKEKYSKSLEFLYVDKNFDFRQIKNSKVYIRSIDVFFKYFLRLKLNKNQIIYDFRALLCVESFDRNHSYPRFIVIFLMEMTAYLLSNRISTVSHRLKNKLHQYFLIKRKVSVFPCLVVGRKRTNKAFTFNPKKEVKFVYMGSISKWQKFDFTIDLYRNCIQDKLNSSLTIITRDNERAKEILALKGVKGTVKSLTNEEVLTDLKNYDFGFLLRDNSLLNNVSSPIKFQEYLISGVIPVMSEGIGDYSDEVQKHNLAVIVEESGYVDFHKFIELLKDESLDQRLQTYMQTYNFEERVKEHSLLIS